MTRQFYSPERTQLIEIASSEPSSHVSVKAAEVVVRIGREQTSIEKDPYGVLDFPVEFDED